MLFQILLSNGFSYSDMSVKRFTTSISTAPKGIWTRQMCHIRVMKRDLTTPNVTNQIIVLYRPVIWHLSEQCSIQSLYAAKRNSIVVALKTRPLLYLQHFCINRTSRLVVLFREIRVNLVQKDSVSVVQSRGYRRR